MPPEQELTEVEVLRAKVAEQAAVITYLETKLAQQATAPRIRLVEAPARAVPTFAPPSTAARGIPGLAVQVLRNEPRHMTVSELQERMRLLGLDVKRSSISRSLSRDDRFTAYPDGWGFTVPPASGDVLVNTTTNGSHIQQTPPWVSAPPPLRR
jgi:hypothetical protein